MKHLRLTSAAAALAGALALVPLQAQSATLKFLDVQTLGGTNTFITVDKLNTNVGGSGNYATIVSLGADNALSVGDTFTESFDLISVSSLPPFTNALSFDYKIAVSLTGAITSLTGPGTITVGPGNAVTNTGAIFDVAFTSATLSLWDYVNNVKVSDLSLVGGGASSIQLVAGLPIADVSLFANLDCTPACDPYLQDANGGSLAGKPTLTITSGSAKFLNYNGSTYDELGSTLYVNFFDNGQATVFPAPEPGALSLLGLGLFGLAFSRRAKKSA